MNDKLEIYVLEILKSMNNAATANMPDIANSFIQTELLKQYIGLGIITFFLLLINSFFPYAIKKEYDELPSSKKEVGFIKCCFHSSVILPMCMFNLMLNILFVGLGMIVTYDIYYISNHPKLYILKEFLEKIQ